jgi:hypothetical protein
VLIIIDMSWIEDRLKERKTESDRIAKIAPYTEIMYGNLWNEVIRCVTEAQSAGFRLFTNETTFERILRLTKLPSGNLKELIITLNRQQRTILVVAPSRRVEFGMDLCPDGVVCLQHDGKEIMIPDAAKLILDPFFFPEHFS